MGKAFSYSCDLDKETEKLLRQGQFLGEGNNGIVFELPGNKIIKIFKDEMVCRKEADTYRRTSKSKYFPKMYRKGKLYIVREKIHGERLDKFIKKNGFSQKLGENIYKLLKDFKRLKFKKIDIRCKDLYVDDDWNVRVIDPKNYYNRERSYPRHLMKGIEKVGALDSFLRSVKEIDKEKGMFWQHKYSTYKKNIGIEK